MAVRDIAAPFEHGGARRSGVMPSSSLTEAQCLLVLRAASRALLEDTPLNRWITILWERGGVPAEKATAATTEFIGKFGDFLRPFGFKAKWTYVHEGGPRNGIHAHLLMHVPERLDLLFRSRPRVWADAILPDGYSKGVVKSLRAPALPEDEVSRYAAWLEAHVHYMLKSADALLESRLGLIGCGPKPWGQQTHIVGKRAGAWQNHQPRK